LFSADLFRYFFEFLQVGIDALPEEFEHDGLAVGIFLVDPACLTDAGIAACSALIVQFAISPFDLPAGQELVFLNRALALDHLGAIAEVPAR
jgi:hypothetical protein